MMLMLDAYAEQIQVCVLDTGLKRLPTRVERTLERVFRDVEDQH